MDVWSIGGMMLTGESRNTRRKACAIFPTSNPTWTGLGLNVGPPRWEADNYPLRCAYCCPLQEEYLQSTSDVWRLTFHSSAWTAVVSISWSLRRSWTERRRTNGRRFVSDNKKSFKRLFYAEYSIVSHLLAMKFPNERITAVNSL